MRFVVRTTPFRGMWKLPQVAYGTQGISIFIRSPRASCEHHVWLEPLIISWGYDPEPAFSSGSRFIDYFEWLDTWDSAPFLVTLAAIEFQREYA